MQNIRVSHAELLGSEPVGALLIKYSIPSIIGMLVGALYNLVDRIFVGHGVGALGLAGIAVTTPVTMIMIAASMLIGIGANALFSIRLGEGRRDQVEKIMGNAFVLLLVLPTCIALICAFFLDDILRVMGASEAVLPYARDYLGILLFGLVFQTAGPGFNHFIRSDGHPRTSMFTQLIGAVLNTILDPIFIFVFHWGVAGAAWATVISQIISFTWVFLYFNSSRTNLRFRRVNMRLEPAIVRGILFIGFAPFAIQAAASLLNLVLNRTLVAHGGDIAVSAMGVVLSVLNLLIMPLLGINMGSQPIIGFNYGAKRYDRVIKTYRLSAIAGTMFITVGFLLVQLFPGFFIRLFNSDNADLIELGSFALRTCSLLLPVVAFQISSSNFFQSIGKPVQGSILSLSRQVLVLIPLIMILPNFFGLHGIFFAFPLADAVATTLAFFLVTAEVRSLRNGMGTADASLSSPRK
ncbi:MAG: MATE family efflux transporter [Treponemataceae bacterium]